MRLVTQIGNWPVWVRSIFNRRQKQSKIPSSDGGDGGSHHLASYTLSARCLELTDTTAATTMPSFSERPKTPEPVNGNADAPNGRSGLETLAPSGMALTDYSINPTTPPEDKQRQIRSVVPDEFLLPNGYPDVSHCLQLDAAASEAN